MGHLLNAISVLLLVTMCTYFGWLAREQLAVQECRKLHNVYSCELVATPSEAAE